jgi:transcriptional regulator with XRE-family HTH domain
MRSSVLDVLPPKVKRSLAALGGDIAVARRKRGFTVATMAERMGVSKNTFLRVEKGDPTVTLGIYAMALFVLGFGEALGSLIEPQRDEIGLALDEERLPKRIRRKKVRSFT